jgi:hypothetical protein
MQTGSSDPVLFEHSERRIQKQTKLKPDEVIFSNTNSVSPVTFDDQGAN